MSSPRTSAVLLTAVLLLTACGSGAAPQVTAVPHQTPMEESEPMSPVPEVSPEPTERPSAPPGASPAQPTAWDSVPSGWTEVASFDTAVGHVQVIDLRAWSGGFIAIGLAQRFEETGEVREPRIWTSADGTTWTQTDPDLGSTDVDIAGLLVPETGGVVIVGLAGRRGTGEERVAAWRSADGVTWTPVDLPSEMADPSWDVAAVSGPVGHLIKVGSTVWYSDDLESWEQVLVADDNAWVDTFDAGDEGFVVGGERVYASGDGRSWHAGPQSLLGVAALRGDWYAWTYSEEPSTISIMWSANGLQWAPVLDVNDLTAPDGPKAGKGMESEITAAALAADAGVLVLTLTWNHCCVLPSQGVGVFASIDGANWTDASLPAAASVVSLAGNGDVLVAAGALGRGQRAVFWVAER